MAANRKATDTAIDLRDAEPPRGPMSSPTPAFETRTVMKGWHHVVFWGLTALLALATLQFALYWYSIEEWSDRPWAMGVLTVVLLLFLAQYLQSWTTMPRMRRPIPPAPEPNQRVALATTFVPGAEPLEMLELTVAAMVGVDYPHDSWVLDEKNDPAVAEICARHGARHFTRHGREDLNRPEGSLKARTKYGNINAWLSEKGFGEYDVIGFFDPDHIPEPDFLDRTMGYLRDPSVGFVQGAQIYYNQGAGFIARGAAEESYSYYSSTLMAAFGMGHTVMVGCHNVHRAEALEGIGGLAAHDADDLLTALHYQREGWRGVYVPEVTAGGITPVAWPAYLTQQRRWARSVLDIKLRHLPKLWPDLPKSSRWFSLLQGASYPIDVALPMIGISLLTWILITGEASILSRLFGQEFLMLLLVIAGINVFRQAFFLEPGRERGLHWRAGVLRAAKWPWVALGMWEALVGSRTTYELTAKGSSTPLGARALLPHLLIGVVVLGAYTWSLATDRIAYWTMHFWGPFLTFISLGVFATGFWRPPTGYDRELWESWQEGRNEGES